ncbi:MAG: NFACT family protein [Thermoplasmata archaeon]|nr:NFACT family protein [Thermoplasmata archaeon]
MSGPSVEKDRFTSLDTLALVRELRALGPARVDKAFDGPGGALSITLRAPGVGRRELFIIPGRYAALLPVSKEHGEEPGPFARELRRLLTGAALAELEEPGGERYLEIAFRRADSEGPVILAVELFGTGNVLVAREGKLAAVLHPKSWAHRTVRVGSPYSAPPRRVDPWKAGAAELEAALTGSRTDRVTTLAARMGFGGPVAEELLARAQLPGQAPAPEDAAQSAQKIHDAVRTLLSEVGDHPVGRLYIAEGVPVDVEPFHSRRFQETAGVVEQERASFSEAANEFFQSVLASAAPPPTPVDLARAGLLRQQTQQEAAVMALEEEARGLAARAEAIYANYAEALKVLEAAKGVADGELVIEAELGGMRVPLRVGHPLEASAQSLYDESKRVRAKLDGARVALAETVGQLQKAAVASPSKGVGARAARRRGDEERSRHWFQQHRWFISSEGAVVIGGKDATSNDRIVRRHLNPRDRYVHADIQGAASVIVKSPAPGEPEITDRTMREAGQWAVAFSKAWRAGLASASAFWVNADQVSKAAASGEFVPRGAFVIHGTKNIMRDLPTELALGTIRYSGEELLEVAPPQAVQSRGEVRFVVSPGDERERAKREVELAEASGIPRSRLQGLLPAGGLSFRRA